MKHLKEEFPELLHQASRLFGAETEPVYFAAGHEWSDGIVYQFQKSGVEHLLKVLKPESPNQKAIVTERMAFVEYLRDSGLKLLSPVRSVENNLVEEIGEDRKYCVYCWQKCQAEPPKLQDPKLETEFYYNWGAWLGKAHSLSKAYPSWLESGTRDESGRAAISQEAEWKFFLNWNQNPRMQEAWREIQGRLGQLARHRDNHGFIHNDPHPGNMLLEDGALVLIDWDVANYHWFMMDIAIAVYSEYSRVNYHSSYRFRNNEMPQLFLSPFLLGYCSQNKLATSDWMQLELFLQYRRYMMCTVFEEQIRASAPAYLEKFQNEIISFKPYLPESINILSLLP